MNTVLIIITIAWCMSLHSGVKEHKSKIEVLERRVESGERINKAILNFKEGKITEEQFDYEVTTQRALDAIRNLKEKD